MTSHVGNSLPGTGLRLKANLILRLPRIAAADIFTRGLHWQENCVFSCQLLMVLTTPSPAGCCLHLFRVSERKESMPGTIPPEATLTQWRQHQAMLFPIIIIALLSLLVATDPEH